MFKKYRPVKDWCKKCGQLRWLDSRDICMYCEFEEWKIEALGTEVL